MANRILLLLIISTITAGCSTQKSLTSTAGPKKVDEAQLLMDMMTGSYNSAKQADRDSTYYDITLHMYPVWEDRVGQFLYVEQSLTSKQDKPYRQRIYEIESHVDGSLTSTLYKLQDEERFIGKYDRPRFFDQFDKSVLELREGCTVFLKKNDIGYSGGTRGNECLSTMRGSAYATAIVNIRPTMVISWDRGFDSDGNYVWGAEKSGYIFNLVSRDASGTGKTINSTKYIPLPNRATKRE